jgi:hypothetical protein
MRKENGRLTPADEKETAGIYGKTFKCVCGATKQIEKAEFGMVVVCDACGKGMNEESSESSSCTGRG